MLNSAREKDPSLFVGGISDEGKKFYKTDTWEVPEEVVPHWLRWISNTEETVPLPVKLVRITILIIFSDFCAPKNTFHQKHYMK